VLRRAGLLSERRDGARRLYRADREALGSLEVVLRDMWEQDLDRLKDAIERGR
jgi:DNA-binding transcriptional ArsR family regulator